VASGAPVPHEGAVSSAFVLFVTTLDLQALVQLCYGAAHGPSGPFSMRMRQSINQFEVAFEQETTLERHRREQLRRRAANRSRVRRMTRNEQQGKVRFSVLAVCLTATVAVVIVSMFEALSFLMA
jgi:hypothetical protein